MADLRNHAWPWTVSDVLMHAPVQPTPDEVQAVKALARAKPWRGTAQERLGKLKATADALATACRVPPVRVVAGVLDGGTSFGSTYEPRRHKITLHGKLSVVTFLHLFARHRGWNGLAALGWSAALFARCFPHSYAQASKRSGAILAPSRN